MINGKNKAKCKRWERTAAYKKLKQDMLDDLEFRGMIGTQYTSKVDEYMQLWCILQMLTEDIMSRGVSVEYSNGATQKGTTENKSLSAATRVSSQMLNIWSALGFRDLAANAKPPVGGEDDEL